jgi:hypothetical protein
MHMLGIMVEEIATDDVEIYEWLRNVVETLGNEGMSSDESSVEDDGTVIYAVKQLPWRRRIDKELSIIDSLRTQEPTLYSARGSRPIKRHRGADSPVSTRKPVRGLARAFYDEEWLQRQPHGGRRLEVSEKPFRWMKLYSS